MELLWLSNTPDPKRFSAERMADETQAEAEYFRREWLKDKIVGDPMPTKFYSIAQLKESGMVGVYQIIKRKGGCEHETDN